jgi:hypothetical protein
VGDYVYICRINKYCEEAEGLSKTMKNLIKDSRPLGRGSRNVYSMVMCGHVARIEETRNACRILVRKHERREHLADIDADGRIILKLILRKSI